METKTYGALLEKPTRKGMLQGACEPDEESHGRRGGLEGREGVDEEFCSAAEAEDTVAESSNNLCSSYQSRWMSGLADVGERGGEAQRWTRLPVQARFPSEGRAPLFALPSTRGLSDALAQFGKRRVRHIE